MHKSFKYRLYPNKEQRWALEQTLETCRRLYNDTLAWRKEAYEQSKHSVSYYEQAMMLPSYKAENPFLLAIYSQVLQDVLRRVDKSYKAFYRRVKDSEEEPGYPRFKSGNRYNSFTYPQIGFKVTNRKLCLVKVGDVNIKLHRPLEGAVKTCTIRRDVDQWYACFSVELPDAPVVEARSAVGVDVGLESLVTLSSGEKISPPRFLKRSEDQLAREQRRLNKKKKGSNNRRRQRLRVARLHRKIRNQRLDANHKMARRLVNNYDFIAFEDLQIKNMLGNHYLAKSISDASWGNLRVLTAFKAEEAGKTVALVNPHRTSQECSRCGTVVEKDLSERVHTCFSCGLSIDRDVNAAINILSRSGWEPPNVPAGGVSLEAPMNQEAALSLR